MRRPVDVKADSFSGRSFFLMSFRCVGVIDEFGLASIRTLVRQLGAGCMKGSASNSRGGAAISGTISKIKELSAVTRPGHLV